MAKYQVGDNVRFTGGNAPEGFPKEHIHTIKCVDSGGQFYVLDRGAGNGCKCGGGHTWSESGSNVELVNKKITIMTKVSNMMKKLLDKDTQTLVKAGFINGDLQLTEEGKIELLALQFDALKPQLVASAQVKIDEEKENSK